jgi:hypothetical protein
MAFNRFTKNVLNVSGLPDRVQNQAQALKLTFDQAGVDIKNSLNGLMDELESNTSAENLGAKTHTGEKSTVQELLDGMFTSISDKVEKEEGKQLSTEDYTAEEKMKLASIAEGANNYVLPQASTAVLGGVKVDGSTIVIEDGVAKAKASDAADYTARAEIEVLKTNKAETKKYNAIIPVEGWTDAAPYTIDITVVGMLETDGNFPVSPIYTTEEYSAQSEAWNKISFIDSGTDKITVTCMEEKPTTAVPIQIMVVR